MQIFKAFFPVIIAVSVVLSSFVQAEKRTLAEVMAEYLECYPVDLVYRNQQLPVIARRDICLAAIYHETGARPLWVSEEGPGPRAEVIYKFLKNADREGLDSSRYQVQEIAALWHDPSFISLSRLDTLLTFNAVRYIHDASHGQIEPFLADPQLFAEAGKINFDPVGLVEQLLVTEDLEKFFQEILPRNSHYQALKKGLWHYQNLVGQLPWTPLKGGRTIYPGDSDERIPDIRARLALLLEKNPTSAADAEAVYDAELEAAVLTFQERHGLKADGIIGRNTLAQLNVSPAQRVRQIKVNMARWRWQDHDFGNDYILVNIADFRLYGYRDGELKLSLPVIVGESQHQTPVFSDYITYVEFNPFWNVPPSIAVKEELLNLRKNPLYLAEKNIRVFSSWQEGAVELDSTVLDWQEISPVQMARFKLRQDPGPANALGRMKFVFPNHYAIYLHDTPAKNLFEEKQRSFSHGCIRVSKPEQLAIFILNREDDRWDKERIEELLVELTRKVVLVRPPLPVHLTYQTAWVDKSGIIHFNRDIYGRDKKLQEALFLE